MNDGAGKGAATLVRLLCKRLQPQQAGTLKTVKCSNSSLKFIVYERMDTLIGTGIEEAQ